MDRILGALTLPLLPAWAVATALHPRWRVGWRGRWGIAVPPVQPGAIWIHAASVGEVVSAVQIVEALADPVVLTADTETGVRQARALLSHRPAVAIGPKPVDHPWTLAPLWAEARPRAVAFVEGTFWPALAWRARREGVPVLRVAATAGRRTRAIGRLAAPGSRPPAASSPATPTPRRTSPPSTPAPSTSRAIPRPVAPPRRPSSAGTAPTPCSPARAPATSSASCRPAIASRPPPPCSSPPATPIASTPAPCRAAPGSGGRPSHRTACRPKSTSSSSTPWASSRAHTRAPPSPSSAAPSTPASAATRPTKPSPPASP